MKVIARFRSRTMVGTPLFGSAGTRLQAAFTHASLRLMEHKPRPVVDLGAHCACGRVEVAVRGRVQAMLLCACEHCQKATGTGHSAVAVVAESAVTLTGTVAGFEQISDSGATFTRSFCPACGTPVMGRSSRGRGVLMLPVGLFGRETEWFVPNQLIFSRSHRDWDTLPAALPRHETYRGRELA